MLVLFRLARPRVITASKPGQSRSVWCTVSAAGLVRRSATGVWRYRSCGVVKHQMTVVSAAEVVRLLGRAVATGEVCGGWVADDQGVEERP